MGVSALTKKMKRSWRRKGGRERKGWGRQQKNRKVSGLKGQTGCAEALRASVWRQAEPGATRTRTGKGVLGVGCILSSFWKE